MDNMEMHDLAEPMNEMMAVEVPSKKKKKREPYYPSTSFDVKQMPELKGLEIGDKVMLHIEAEVCGIDAYEKRHTVRMKMKMGVAEPMKAGSPKAEKSQKVKKLFEAAPKQEDSPDEDEDY